MNTEIQLQDVQNRIFTIRDRQIIIDRDLAELYGVSTKVLNQAVKRNIERFPESFRFQLNELEKIKLVTNCDRFEKLKHSSVNPYAFTEQGVAMLSAVLRSETAIKVSIQIMQAFVEMRKFISNYTAIFQRLDDIEKRQFLSETKLDKVFKALELENLPAKQGIFFNGQVFDAWVFISNLIKKAKLNLILIDNYINESVLSLFAKKKPGVSIDIYTPNINRSLLEDTKRFNTQYGGLNLHKFHISHDRFLLIDKTEIYHIGASLKDLGKKWFAFSLMEKDSLSIIEKLEI